jgi:hypothetical protein
LGNTTTGAGAAQNFDDTGILNRLLLLKVLVTVSMCENVDFEIGDDGWTVDHWMNKGKRHLP